ncbi:DNA-directed RNA polymerase subunit B [Candidatus Woesearchaeota archaeon]|nr:DNA-directed RNA polymerase subunit B [Candidatus Woesearchaeota archaeon]
MVDVYVNGKYAGSVDNAQDFVDQLISERRRGKLPSNINVYQDKDYNQVFVEAGKGRVRRPLIVIKDGKSTLSEKYLAQLEKGELSWSDLVTQGIVEYVDAAEEENCLVAFMQQDLTPAHTHMEIAPMAILGLCTSLVPFGNYNQSTRLNAGSKNQKQSLGFYAANYHVRMDMDVNVLDNPHRPLCRTIMHDIVDYNEHPSGQNIVVAVMSYRGYNMEDSVILNKASIQRGYGRSTYFLPCVSEELRYSGGLIDQIGIPDKEVKGYKTERDYRFLEDDGIIYPEAQVREADVVIGKTSPPRFLSSMDEYNLTSNLRRESSVSISHGEQGVVDFVMVTENEEGNKLVQVRLRDLRVPEVGDKFTSRHGQKGVVGMIVDQADMPFSANGITPDLIFSPHGIPSRMTIAHLIELVGAKVGALAGRYIDGTTFEAESEDAMRQELVSYGFRENGTETMYNGISGEKFQARIYIGNMYYLKLRHMVANKLHSRARGPVQLLTRQPTEGRAKEGGLRLGEMEKDTFVAHGASMLLKERFDSDKTVLAVCEDCGLLAIHDEYKNRSHCPVCGENSNISQVEIAYAFKLLLDELKALCVYPRIELKNKY